MISKRRHAFDTLKKVFHIHQNRLTEIPFHSEQVFNLVASTQIHCYPQVISTLSYKRKPSMENFHQTFCETSTDNLRWALFPYYDLLITVGCQRVVRVRKMLDQLCTNLGSLHNPGVCPRQSHSYLRQKCSLLG